MWGNSSQTQLNRFRRLLDKYLKTFCKLSPNRFEEERFYIYFDQIYKYFLLTQIFKYYTMNLGPSFRDKLEIRVTEQKYNTRFFIIRNLLHPAVQSS